MVVINVLEQPMLSYYVIYFEKFRKIIQQTEKEAVICLIYMFISNMVEMDNEVIRSCFLKV